MNWDRDMNHFVKVCDCMRVFELRTLCFLVSFGSERVGESLQREVDRPYIDNHRDPSQRLVLGTMVM